MYAKFAANEAMISSISFLTWYHMFMKNTYWSPRHITTLSIGCQCRDREMHPGNLRLTYVNNYKPHSAEYAFTGFGVLSTLPLKRPRLVNEIVVCWNLLLKVRGKFFSYLILSNDLPEIKDLYIKERGV